MKNAVICDLDGTLVSTNTFSRYTLRMLRNPRLMLPLVWLVAKRKMRLASHAQTKQKILALTRPWADANFINRFSEIIVERHLRDSVYAMVMAEKKKGCVLLLATAAPASYAEAIARYTGFDACIGTHAGAPENSGQHKRQAVEKWLADNDARFSTFVTDHSDDLPLMSLATKCDAAVWLVKPSEETRMRTRHLHPQEI